MQNYISATDAGGKRFTLFTPLAPYETVEAMQEICEEYNHAIGEGNVATRIQKRSSGIVTMESKRADKLRCS